MDQALRPEFEKLSLLDKGNILKFLLGDYYHNSRTGVTQWDPPLSVTRPTQQQVAGTSLKIVFYFGLSS